MTRTLKKICSKYVMTVREMKEFLDVQHVDDAVDLCYKFRNIYEVEMTLDDAQFILSNCN